VVETENLNVRRHVVQFYGRDEELAERVTDYLLEALDSGDVAIVIATPEHRREFETRLGRAGVDLAAARDDGSYLALDAGQTLRELMAADQLDSAAFDRVIGGMIRRAAAGGRSVRAFGEMVALLWDDGLVNDAVQLEALWEELDARHPFSLFCAYRADSMARDIDAYAEVCRLHGRSSAPDPAPSGRSRSAARRPRRHVTSPWPRWLPGAPRTSPTTPPWW
jgi:hypothetical protein